MTDNLYKKLSQERKALQEQGHLPEWFTTSGYQLFLEKYNYGTKTRGSYLEQCQRIAKTAARHTTNPAVWYGRFFDIIWKGWLSCSTPVLANMGTERGLPVSCSGGHVRDSVDGFYTSRREAALLTKYGFGTSGYLGEIRPRGSVFGSDAENKSTGVLPVLKGFIQDSRDISQGSTRRGAWAGYIEVEHGDFYEIANYLEAQPDDMNIGWIITDEFIKRLNASDDEAIRRYKRCMKVKMVTGKGYFFFRDKVNRARPDWYKDRGIFVRASNLCSEITLPSSDVDSFSCVLSSMNLSHYDDWVGTDAVFVATVFLDCVAEEFINRAESISGVEKVVGFTRRSRALGLGTCGLHTLYQQKMIPFGSMEAHLLNNSIFSYIRDEAEKATKWMWEEYHFNREIPEYCNGEERWNSHLCVTGDTELLTKEGAVEISTVVGKEIEIWNGHEWTTVTPFETGKGRDVYTVSLSNGSSITCTGNHKWLIKNHRQGKVVVKETGSLSVGDKLDKWDFPRMDGEIVFEHAYASGFFTGDGSYNQSKPQYENCKQRKEVRLYGDKVQLVEFLPIKENCSVRDTAEGGVRFYLDDGVSDKFVVPPINCRLVDKLQWLAGLFDSDGCAAGTISSNDDGFLLEVQKMAMSCGLHSSVKKVKRTGGYGEKDYYFVIQFSVADLNKVKECGFKTHRVKFSDAQVQKRQYVKVVSVVAAGKQDTFCLTDPLRGTAVFNGVKTMQCAIAPTKSTALIMGGVSEGINPDFGMAFMQDTAGGQVERVNPTLLKLMKERGVYSKKVVKEIAEDYNGSVQHVDWLSDHEKDVFKTAFEIDQKAILRQAAARQRWIDQGQSLNLFFSADEDESYISEVHKEAFENENIHGLYYVYSMAGVKAARGECEVCQ